jgi:quinol monooxygenase YgiN
MATLQITNQVRDFDDWKAAFDEYERLRAEHGVQRYRILRSQLDPARVIVHLDFDSDDAADAFLPRLARIWATPRSQQQLVDHEPPEVLTLVTDRVPAT